MHERVHPNQGAETEPMQPSSNPFVGLLHARTKAGYRTAEELAGVLDEPTELVEAWEENALKPSPEQMAAISGALGLALPEVQGLFADPVRQQSRVAVIVRGAIARAGFTPDQLAELLGVPADAAQSLLSTGRYPVGMLPRLAFEVDTDLDDLVLAAELDHADARVNPGPMLSETHPQLVPGYSAGNPIPALSLLVTSDLQVEWVCTTWPQHLWRATVSERLAATCPLCASAFPGNLAETRPDLAREWHADNTSAPTEESKGSTKRRVWQCPRNHRWSATTLARVSGDVGCPSCNSLLTKHPELAREWHRDNRFPAERVLAESFKPAVWRCTNNHVWVCTIADRIENPRCPICSEADLGSWAPVSAYPQYVEEWDDKRDPSTVLANDGQPAKWRCREGHGWVSSPAARVVARIGCSACERGWDLEALRTVVADLGPAITNLSPAELYTLFQQARVGAESQEVSGVIQALSLGILSEQDMLAFAEGRKSQVDPILDDPETVLPSHPGELPNLRVATWTGGGIDVVVDDTSAAEFLVSSGVSRLLGLAFSDLGLAMREANELADGRYTQLVRVRFTQLIEQAEALVTPAGWRFAPEGKVVEPNLMQRVVAVRVLLERRVGNWSGTGAGKTLSALLASRIVDAPVTLVTCPNAVINTWESAIRSTFDGVDVFTKTLRVPDNLTKPAYLVVNYEHLQRPAALEELEALAFTGVVGLVVIDEIHQAKQRDERTASLRRANLQEFIDQATSVRKGLCVLGMSATPVINNLTEGTSLLRLVTGVDPGIPAEPTVSNCIALHQALIRHGIRWMPKYDTEFDYQEILVDCSAELEELRALPANPGVLSVERILTRARLRVLRESIQGKTLVYTHLKDGIVDQLVDAFEEDGHVVGLYTGDDKSGLAGFIDGDVDVLVATSSIGTGVDGLQRVCNRVLVNVLPWTDAEYTQLKGRVWRQGQGADKVEFIVPVTHALVGGEEWSWCRMKLDRLRYKRSVADAAVDGSIPDEHLRNPQQAAEDAIAWLKRISS
jgi:hypothetical protein